MSKQQFKYKPRHAVIVECSGEGDQKRKFEALRKRGWKVRVVVV